MAFVNKYNYVKSEGEKNDQPSETVPQQSFTVQEIYQRHQAGALEDIEKKAIYDDVNEGFNLSFIDEIKDLTDIDRAKLRVEKMIEQKTKLRNEIKKRKKEKQDQYIKDLLDKQQVTNDETTE